MSSTVSERFLAFDSSTQVFILSVVADVVRGSDVNVVAVPYDLAVAICHSAVTLARALGLPCNQKEGDSPVIRPRAYDRQIPLPTPKTKVHIHHSASFERQSSRPPAHRSVLA